MRARGFGGNHGPALPPRHQKPRAPMLWAHGMEDNSMYSPVPTNIARMVADAYDETWLWYDIVHEVARLTEDTGYAGYDELDCAQAHLYTVFRLPPGALSQPARLTKDELYAALCSTHTNYEAGKRTQPVHDEACGPRNMPIPRPDFTTPYRLGKEYRYPEEQHYA